MCSSDLGQLGVVGKKAAGIYKIAFDVPITKISCGAVFSLALSTEGQVYSWGSNTNGQIGVDQSSKKYEVPQKVQIKPKVVDILAGDCHALVMTADNRVFGWGQGTLVEEGEEIVCGQPVEISAGVINEMVYEVAEVPPKSSTPLSKDKQKEEKFLPLDSVKQKALVTQRIQKKNLLGELFTPDK